MATFDSLITQSTIFLRQHAELYGDQVFVETKGSVKPGAPSASNLSQSLDELRNQLTDCQECLLSRSRTQVVFGRGNPKAKLMCVGGYPCREDDAAGTPFTSRDGELLSKILSAIQLSINDVYLTNAVKCCPGLQKDALSAGLEKCSPFLQKQIALVKPRFILALGEAAAQGVLGVDASVAKLRDKIHKLGEIDVLVTYHPNELHDNVELKQATWSDVRMLRKMYDETDLDKKEIRLP